MIQRLHRALLFIIVLFPSFLVAESRVGVAHYLENDVSSGQFICEPQDSSGQVAFCFQVNDFSQNLTPENDASGVMQAKSISDGQGVFIEVQLDQLATSVPPEKFKETNIFDFYLKIHWKGKRSGNLGIELSDRHVAKGRVFRNSSDQKIEIEVTHVPDLYLLSLFMPRLEIAEMFGRNAATQTYELEHDIKLWMTLLISPVLKSYFDQESINLRKP